MNSTNRIFSINNSSNYIYIYWIIITLFISCNGQESKAFVTYPKDKQMSNEYFNVDSFKNYQNEQEKTSNINSPERVTYNGGTAIKEYSLVSSDDGIEYARETLPPTPNLFYSLTIFDEQGKIKKSIDKVFIGVFDFEYGIHKFYNKEGYLTKEIDYNKQFDEVKVKVDDLLAFLSQEDIKINQIDKSTEAHLKEKWFPTSKNVTAEMVLNQINQTFLESKEERGVFEKKILNPYNRQDVERIKIDFDSKNQTWIIVKDFSSLGKITIQGDGNDKKILKSIYTL